MEPQPDLLSVRPAAADRFVRRGEHSSRRMSEGTDQPVGNRRRSPDVVSFRLGALEEARAQHETRLRAAEEKLAGIVEALPVQLSNIEHAIDMLRADFAVEGSRRFQRSMTMPQLVYGAVATLVGMAGLLVAILTHAH